MNSGQNKSALKTVLLAHADDWEGFRSAARNLLCADVHPESIHWRIADDAQGHLDLFGTAGDAGDAHYLAGPGDQAESGVGRGSRARTDNKAKNRINNGMKSEADDGVVMRNAPHKAGNSTGLRLPRTLLEALSLVILHRAPERLHCLYRFLWRWQREPALRCDPLDPDMKAINDYYRDVRHDACRMLGFVRFRPWMAQRRTMAGCLESESERWRHQSRQEAWHVAWYEPRHRVLHLVAPHFVQRFPGHCWAIVTPDACATWDMAHLEFHAGAVAVNVPPPDAGEVFWLTYYANHFNAARRNPVAFRRCMPVDYWKHLPEARLIAALLAE